MPFLDVSSVLLVLAAVFGWVNHKYIKLPTTIGVMLIGLVMSLLLLLLKGVVPAIPEAADHFAESIDFSEALMQGMLSYLLFADDENGPVVAEIGSRDRVREISVAHPAPSRPSAGQPSLPKINTQFRPIFKTIPPDEIQNAGHGWSIASA